MWLGTLKYLVSFGNTDGKKLKMLQLSFLWEFDGVTIKKRWLTINVLEIPFSCSFHDVTDCKLPICEKEISIFDLPVFWMESLSTEVMEIMLIVIDATPWLPNNNQ